MSSTTIIIIVAVAVIWAILFAVFMKFNKKRQAGEQQFVQENANKAITKTKNVETQPVTITIPVQAGNEYNAAMYFYSAEQRNAYYKGDVDDAVLEVELELESGFTANTHAYIIVYRECK